MEIKNVTAIGEKRQAIFPDAVTIRGQKHLRELINVVKKGSWAVIFFCVQRCDVDNFRAATEIDPEYATLLAKAIDQGVEALAYKAKVAPGEIELQQSIPVIV